MWTTPPSVFHAAGLKVEHVLEVEKGHRGVSPGKEAEPQVGSDPCVQLERRSGGGGRNSHLWPLRWGQHPSTKAPFKLLLPLSYPGSMGSGQTAGRKCHCFPASQAHLASMPHCDESADGLEGSGAAGQQMGPVMGL